jgi:hypothetical protein
VRLDHDERVRALAGLAEKEEYEGTGAENVILMRAMRGARLRGA